MNDREQFELLVAKDWDAHDLPNFDLNPLGDYVDDEMFSAFAWFKKGLAARATPAQPVPDLYEAEKLLPYEIRYFKTPGMAEKLGHKVLATYSRITPAGEIAGKSVHSDDTAVDSFCAAMKGKMADGRAKGRYGWDNALDCSIRWLAVMLVRCVAKGDMRDVGNLAMMLFHRGSTADDTKAALCQYLYDEAEALKGYLDVPRWAVAPSPAIASPSSVGDAIRAIELPEPVGEVQAWFRGEWDYTRVNGNYYTASQITRLLSEAAALAEQVPEGYVLVPTEPTAEMIAACDFSPAILSAVSKPAFVAAYKCMVAAAPSIPQDGQKSGADHG